MTAFEIIEVVGYIGVAVLVVTVAVLALAELSPKARKTLGVVAGVSGLAVALKWILGNPADSQDTTTGKLDMPDDTRGEDDTESTNTDRDIDRMRDAARTPDHSDDRISADRKRELDEFIEE